MRKYLADRIRKSKGKDAARKWNDGGEAVPKDNLYGIKVLKEPEPDIPAVVDIVFAHGLTGHPEQTWRCTGALSIDQHSLGDAGSITRGSSWPELLLPAIIPQARILTFGYDADIAHFSEPAGQNSIRDHAADLVAHLAAKRDHIESPNRPIIFVVHSLGGLVCEDALLLSKNSAEPHLQKILECTRGIAFFGTPHAGADLAKFALALANLVRCVQKPNKDLLKILKRNSEVLARIQDDFHTMIRVRKERAEPDIKIHCYIEQIPVSGIRQKSVLTYVKLVVPPESAKLPQYSFSTIRSNHMDMTKFRNQEDPGFQLVSSDLLRWVKALEIPKGSKAQEVGLRLPPPTYRVQGIPATWDSAKTETLLAAYFSETWNGKICGINIHSLAVSINKHTPSQQVATITFENTPEPFYDAKPDGTTETKAEVDFNISGHNITFDCHFHGFTPLCYTNDEDHEIDHAFGCWQSRDNKFMWLRDSLPYLRGLRVVIYGYDGSKLQGSNTPQNLSDITQAFNRYIKSMRVKVGAINEMSVNDRDNFKSIYGVLFFGVPNQGLKNGQWQSITQGRAKRSLIDGLEPGSLALRTLHETFCSNFTFEDSKVISIYETEVASIIEVDSNGRSLDTGRLGILVPRESAEASLPAAPNHKSFPIHRNHHEIGKFTSPHDQEYIQILDELTHFRDDAVDVVRSRFVLDDQGILRITAGIIFEELEYQQTRANSSDSVHDSTAWFFKSPEYETWINGTNGTPEFLWYSRNSDSRSIEIILELLDRLEVVGPRRYTAERIVVAFLCSRCLNWEERMILQAAVDLTEPIGEASLWAILRRLLDTTSCREFSIIVDNVEDLLPGDRTRFLSTLLEYITTARSDTQRNFRVLVASTRVEEIKTKLERFPFIDLEKEAIECLNSLRLKAQNNRERSIEEVQLGTGAWISSDSRFESWRSSGESSLLWILGKPGSGKSTLLKQILKCLLSMHNLQCLGEIPEEAGISIDQRRTVKYSQNKQPRTWSRQSEVTVASFFYSRRGGFAETGHSQMLQSLLFQILKRDIRLYTLFRGQYRSLKTEQKKSQVSWGLEDLQRVFSGLSCFNDFPLRIYLIIDAVDESDDDGRSKTLSLLSDMCSKKHPCIIKAVLGSRYSRDIRASLANPVYTITLDSENGPDIERVVDTRIDDLRRKLGRKREQTSPGDALDELSRYLVNNSRGVFLWVVLVMKALEPFAEEGCSDRHIKKVAEELPLELQDLYEGIVCKLDRSDFNVDTTRKMFAWAISTRRPLTVGEFRDAMAISENVNLSGNLLKENRHEPLERMSVWIAARCGGLLEIHRLQGSSNGAITGDAKPGDTVQLLHHTTREFLLSKHTNPFIASQIEAESLIATACVRYLILSLSGHAIPGGANFSKEDARCWRSGEYRKFVEYLSDRPLLTYALKFLPEHLEEPNKKSAIDLKQSILQIKKEPWSPSWCLLALWSQNFLRGFETDFGMCHGQPFRTTTLVTAARHGYSNVVKILIAAGTVIDEFDRLNNFTALQAAAFSGHCRIVEYLIGIGANTAGALHGAALNGHEAVTKLLLENGADVNARDDNGWTALDKAAESGHETVVRLLLKPRLLGVFNNTWSNALLRAAKNGHQAVVKVLLDRGVMKRIRGTVSWKALHKAAKNGHEAVVKMLLNVIGASGQVWDTNGWKALHKAAVNGHETVVRVLLEKVVDINAKNGDGRTALHWAGESGHEAVVRLLLENGADVDSKDRFGWTALRWASGGGHEAVVRLLLENGADVDSKDRFEWTALRWASEGGHEAVVRLLLEDGADANAKDGYGWTALHWAGEGGHEAVVRLLLNKGADVNAMDKHGWETLSWAANGGHESVIRPLLEKGADVDAMDSGGWTALCRAADRGHEAVVQLLLEKGADVDAMDRDGWTALRWAANGGHESVVRLLLKMGANVNAKDNDGWTVLRWAASGCHEAVVQLLLEWGSETPAST
ncbi:hypothetical protein FGG08_006488 [Glutinoglossum americanum]|uniref:Ankyrin repeat domain-containing protein 50 n=1 Tax=Glutinoglossum americanum TaxID=1670608 RepID=A0A9P8I564_9PEZI|nr:hypothetical protein FGG08_006488 [Glutinoglossum americanum]